MIGHVAPEAALGGPIAVVQEGDSIVIDVDRKALDLEVPADEVATTARGAGRRPTPRYTGGVMAKYAALVDSASRGRGDDRRPDDRQPPRALTGVSRP